MVDVIDEIRAERERQILQEGWTAKHDDENHFGGQLARAAAAYAVHASVPDGREFLCQVEGRTIHGGERRFSLGAFHPVNAIWPWDAKWWKPKDRRRDLVRAAALIVAEIERLDRATLAKEQDNG